MRTRRRKLCRGAQNNTHTDRDRRVHSDMNLDYALTERPAAQLKTAISHHSGGWVGGCAKITPNPLMLQQGKLWPFFKSLVLDPSQTLAPRKCARACRGHPSPNPQTQAPIVAAQFPNVFRHENSKVHSASLHSNLSTPIHQYGPNGGRKIGVPHG